MRAPLFAALALALLRAPGQAQMDAIGDAVSAGIDGGLEFDVDQEITQEDSDYIAGLPDLPAPGGGGVRLVVNNPGALNAAIGFLAALNPSPALLAALSAGNSEGIILAANAQTGGELTASGIISFQTIAPPPDAGAPPPLVSLDGIAAGADVGAGLSAVVVPDQPPSATPAFDAPALSSLDRGPAVPDQPFTVGDAGPSDVPDSAADKAFADRVFGESNGLIDVHPALGVGPDASASGGVLLAGPAVPSGLTGPEAGNQTADALSAGDDGSPQATLASAALFQSPGEGPVAGGSAAPPPGGPGVSDGGVTDERMWRDYPGDPQPAAGAGPARGAASAGSNAASGGGSLADSLKAAANAGLSAIDSMLGGSGAGNPSPAPPSDAQAISFQMQSQTGSALLSSPVGEGSSGLAAAGGNQTGDGVFAGGDLAVAPKVQTPQDDFLAADRARLLAAYDSTVHGFNVSSLAQQSLETDGLGMKVIASPDAVGPGSGRLTDFVPADEVWSGYVAAAGMASKPVDAAWQRVLGATSLVVGGAASGESLLADTGAEVLGFVADQTGSSTLRTLADDGHAVAASLRQNADLNLQNGLDFIKGTPSSTGELFNLARTDAVQRGDSTAANILAAGAGADAAGQGLLAGGALEAAPAAAASAVGALLMPAAGAQIARTASLGVDWAAADAAHADQAASDFKASLAETVGGFAGGVLGEKLLAPAPSTELVPFSPGDGGSSNMGPQGAVTDYSKSTIAQAWKLIQDVGGDTAHPDWVNAQVPDDVKSYVVRQYVENPLAGAQAAAPEPPAAAALEAAAPPASAPSQESGGRFTVPDSQAVQTAQAALQAGNQTPAQFETVLRQAISGAERDMGGTCGNAGSCGNATARVMLNLANGAGTAFPEPAPFDARPGDPLYGQISGAAPATAQPDQPAFTMSLHQAATLFDQSNQRHAFSVAVDNNNGGQYLVDPTLAQFFGDGNVVGRNMTQAAAALGGTAHQQLSGLLANGFAPLTPELAKAYQSGFADPGAAPIPLGAWTRPTDVNDFTAAELAAPSPTGPIKIVARTNAAAAEPPPAAGEKSIEPAPGDAGFSKPPASGGRFTVSNAQQAPQGSAAPGPQYWTKQSYAPGGLIPDDAFTAMIAQGKLPVSFGSAADIPDLTQHDLVHASIMLKMNGDPAFKPVADAIQGVAEALTSVRDLQSDPVAGPEIKSAFQSFASGYDGYNAGLLLAEMRGNLDALELNLGGLCGRLSGKGVLADIIGKLEEALPSDERQDPDVQDALDTLRSRMEAASDFAISESQIEAAAQALLRPGARPASVP